MNYQKLFNYISEEHGVVLLEQDMQEIRNIVNEMQSDELRQPLVMPSLPTDEDIMKWSKEYAEHEILDQAQFRNCAKFMRLCMKGNGA